MKIFYWRAFTGLNGANLSPSSEWIKTHRCLVCMKKLIHASSPFLPAHPAYFTHNFVSGMLSFSYSANPRMHWFADMS